MKTVMPVTLGGVFGFFVIQMINQSVKDANLKYITPFAYFDISKIIETNKYEFSLTLTNWIIIMVLTGLTYIIYRKKDMAF
jgi:ABC-2 type transport system permease protein